MACPICGSNRDLDGGDSSHKCNPRRLARIDRESHLIDSDPEIDPDCEDFDCKLSYAFGLTSEDDRFDLDALKSLRRYTNQ